MLAVMESKYETIKNLHQRVSEFGKAELLKMVPNLLESWGIKSHVDDGVLSQINISNPENGILVIGLRYIKNNGTFTEDIFEVNSSNPNDIPKYYKGKYERERSEYKGTHKQKNISSSPFTSVNTCSFYIKKKYDS